MSSAPEHILCRVLSIGCSVTIAMLALFSALACADSEEKPSSVQPSQMTPTTVAPPVSSEISREVVDDDTFGVPSGFHPNYRLKQDERSNLGKGDIRHKVRIVVPTGLTDAELENNLRVAAKHAYKVGENPHAITVFAYKTGTDWGSAFTAGRLDWAPYGDWNRADEDVPFDQHEVHFDLSESYRPVTQFPIKTATAAEQSLDEMETKVHAQILKDESAVNRRISQRRRQKIYYAAMKALFDDMQSQSGGRETKDVLASVCQRFQISYDTEETIRQEGEDEGWPKPQ